jgi:hypothetical protein
MVPQLKQYLAKVAFYSRLDPKDQEDVFRELQTHFQDEIEELREAGFSATEAAKVVTERFGTAEFVGRQIYEVYSKGSWRQAVLAAVPHLLLAITFFFHLWQNVLWLVAIALAIVTVAMYAWRHGKPSWSYSWMGYSLIPLLAISFLFLFAIGQILSIYVFKGSLLWLVILVYIPVAFWIVGATIISAIRRDWLFASFMLLPFPVVVVWLLALEQDIGLLEYSNGSFQAIDQGIAFTFLALGGVAGAFIRLRQRLLKIGVLTIATLLILGMVWRFTESGFNPVLSFFVSFCLVCFLLSPVLLQNKIERLDRKIEAWDESWLGHAAKKLN